mmetsp:Transcript_7348/g.15899  ORF Transcript_7348/g.15899 Transcript_7348/m.15899 type:complete len:266 (+) Transcript_7348:1472-2269(+)
MGIALLLEDFPYGPGQLVHRRLHPIFDQQKQMFPRHDDEKKRRLSQTVPQPRHLSRAHGHQGAVGEHRRHGDHVQHVFPDPQPPRLLRQGSSASAAQFEGFETKSDQIVEEYDEGREGKDEAEAGDVGELRDGVYVIVEFVVFGQHHLLPDQALGLVEENSPIGLFFGEDGPAALGVDVGFQGSLFAAYEDAFFVDAPSMNEQGYIYLHQNSGPVHDGDVYEKTCRHSKHAIAGGDGEKGIIIERGEVGHEMKGEYFENEAVPIL